MKIAQFFQDDEGRLSSMRLYSFIALILSVFLSVRAFNEPTFNMEMLYIWVTAAFAPKVVQKLIERMVEKK